MGLTTWKRRLKRGEAKRKHHVYIYIKGYLWVFGVIFNLFCSIIRTIFDSYIYINPPLSFAVVGDRSYRLPHGYLLKKAANSMGRPDPAPAALAVNLLGLAEGGRQNKLWYLVALVLLKMRVGSGQSDSSSTIVAGHGHSTTSSNIPIFLSNGRPKRNIKKS